MALVVVAAPLQWAFASQAESALRTPVATQTATVVAQSDKTHSVKGRVFDELGEPLIGATISVEGTNVKTVTDIDGNFSISTQKAPASTMLRISYMGYKDKVVSGAANLNVTMQLDQQSIDEVVVTALGIKREKKMLGYSVQEVKADKLNVTGDPSVVGALDGKVAGLQMNTASTGLGGSTKITIRGNSSLTDNNQPLWIVDGVPFTDDQTSSASTYGGYDRGGTSFDINPEDIESISVLKGPNAAALYGSRAGNGVILVTTKRGSHKQGFGVSYSGNFTWSQAAETLKMQKLYGQGSQGQFLFNKDEDGNPTTMTGELAFGPRFDGSMQTNWLGEKAPYSYTGDRLKDYFRTGFSQAHTVAVGTSSEKSHFRLSVGYNGNDGLFQNESLNKINVDLNAGATVNKWLSLDGKISVSNTKAENRPYTGLNGEVAQLLLMPGNVSLRDLKENYTSPNQLHRNWFGPDQHYSNPYYARHRFKNSDERWRAFGYYAANVNITDWLKFNAKYSFDYYRTRLQTSDLSLGDGAISTDGTGWEGKLVNDGMTRAEENHFEQNIQFLLMGDNQLAKKWRLGYTAGANIMYLKFEQLSASVQNMLEKDNWIFNTGNKLTSALDDGHSRAMYSAFASAQLAYDEWLSLDLTARNDWSSTLPKKNNSFFYPSASLSWVFSDFMRSIDHKLPSWITFAKLRVSAAQVGKDPAPYNLYNVRKYQFEMGNRKPINNTIKLNANLKPEIKTSYEVGVDMKFLDNRLGFDFTYYYNTTKNQAMLVDASSPWTQQWVNAGKINNTGVEFMLYGTPVKTRDFQFDITRIYYAFLALANTDTYGDMPFTEYVQAKVPETNNVAYNTQEEVYDAMFLMLEQAVDSIKPDDASQYKIDKDDICYFGDANKWLRFANTLRLRLALRISNVAPERAKKEAEAALNNKYGLMTSNADNMQTVPRHAPVEMGGEDSGGDENGLAMCSVAYGGESVLSKDMEDFYRNLSDGGKEYTIKKGRKEEITKKIDPRCLICWYRSNMTSSTLAEGKDALRNDFVGCERGAQAPQISMDPLQYSLTRTVKDGASKDLPDDHWFNYSRPTVWLGYAESLFLKAEAALRGWAGADLTMGAEQYFRAGVKASMDYYHIASEDADKYINGIKALNDGTFESGDRERILEAIITQKWMAVFPNGNEGWADFRRTDYPALRTQLSNFSGGDVPNGKQIKRLLYPNSESQNKFFQAHPELQTANTQGTRLWWDVSDTNDAAGNRQQPNNFR